MALILAFNKQINDASIDPSYFTTVRKKLDLDQREAAEIFGGGVMPFRGTKTAKPSRRWLWSNCSKFRISPPLCWRKCGWFDVFDFYP
jgi:Antitoxin component of bacterial toxin-antitoxin system, MqsA